MTFRGVNGVVHGLNRQEKRTESHDEMNEDNRVEMYKPAHWLMLGIFEGKNISTSVNI